MKERVGELFTWPRERPWGLVSDVDGTIADIAARPGDARVRPGCRQALEVLAKRLPIVAVVSGRDVRTALEMVGVEGLVYFGNHGLERWERGSLSVAPETQEYKDDVQETARLLRDRIQLPGVQVEDKGVGLTIHYRMSSHPDQARSAVLAALDDIGAGQRLDVRHGRMTLELRLPVNVHKGTVVRSLAEEFRLQGAIILGDDLTDVDGFRAARRLQEESGFANISIAVVSEETPEELTREAGYTLPGVAAVEEFLLWLSQTVQS